MRKIDENDDVKTDLFSSLSMYMTAEIDICEVSVSWLYDRRVHETLKIYAYQHHSLISLIV